MRRIILKSIVLKLALFLITSCNNQTLSDQQASSLTSFAPGEPNLRLNLTDAPRDDVASVYVNIKAILIKLDNDAYMVGSDYGPIDLLTLRDGVIMPTGDLSLPIGGRISQIRFLLHDHGNYLVYNDGSECDLQTPSSQQSGYKIIVNNEHSFEEGMDYSLTVDFDAMKSIVIKGNDNCLLKPVLKVAEFKQTDSNDVNNDGSTSGPGDDASEDDSNDDSNSGSDSGDDTSSDSGDDTSSDSGDDTSSDSGDDASSDSGDGSGTSDEIDCQNLGFDPFDENAVWPDDLTWDDILYCY